METNNEKPKAWSPSKSKIVIMQITCMLLFGLLLSIVFFFYGKNSSNPELKEKENKITHLMFELDRIGTLYNSTSYTKDSLFRINMLLSNYRALTDAMSFRDSIRKPLMYTRGDIVILKRDSSRAVIKDILVGGGKYDYYIKYQVEFKDKNVETIDPELIY